MDGIAVRERVGVLLYNLTHVHIYYKLMRILELTGDWMFSSFCKCSRSKMCGVVVSKTRTLGHLVMDLF